MVEAVQEGPLSPVFWERDFCGRCLCTLCGVSTQYHPHLTRNYHGIRSDRGALVTPQVPLLQSWTMPHTVSSQLSWWGMEGSSKLPYATLIAPPVSQVDGGAASELPERSPFLALLARAVIHLAGCNSWCRAHRKQKTPTRKIEWCWQPHHRRAALELPLQMAGSKGQLQISQARQGSLKLSQEPDKRPRWTRAGPRGPKGRIMPPARAVTLWDAEGPRNRVGTARREQRHQSLVSSLQNARGWRIASLLPT